MPGHGSRCIRLHRTVSRHVTARWANSSRRIDQAFTRTNATPRRVVPVSAGSKGLKEMPGSLRIVIVGGGIGGLTAALALRARGLDASVFEQAEVLREIGAGVSIHPNT
jgi:hypothetical protein